MNFDTTLWPAISTCATVLSLALAIHDKHPGLLQKIFGAILCGIPFGFIKCSLPIAIILFTLVRIYGIYKDARKPNLSVVDAFWTMANLCIQSGFFAAAVVFVKY